ncbi:MAG: ABC transporter permease [Thermomicrobiales bacterium]
MASSSPTYEETRGAGQMRADRLIDLVSRVREFGLIVALLVIVIIVRARVDRFTSINNIKAILVSVAILAVLAVGQTLVVLTRNVDLSVASQVGMVAYLSGYMFKHNHINSLFVVILFACGLGIAMGAVNGLLVTVGRVPAIVATLGTLYVFRGLDFWIASGKQIIVSDVPKSYRGIAMNPWIGNIPNPIIIAGAIALIFGFLLRYTRTGRQLYAIGSNPPAARLAGLRSDLLVFGAYTTCGLLCGVAGILWGARFGSVDARAASGYELQVIAATVVGGVNIFGGSGTVFGAVLGAVLLGTIANALTVLRLSEFWLQAISGAVILLAVTLDALITRRLQRALIARRNR